MNTIDSLHQRLQDLTEVLKNDQDALALLGLGSVGLETSRLDQWSDLDFFAIVRPGTKTRFLEDSTWLDKAHPVVYKFKNTPDGYKLLFQDGIFGEMAVFEPQELSTIPYSEGRVLWHREEFDPGLLKPVNQGGRKWTPPSAEFLVGELLTCLYVGMCRFRRGEKLSAWRFIQGYCLDRFLELAEFWETPEPGLDDPYNRDRRFEDRFPQAAGYLNQILLGYEGTPDAALTILSWVEKHTPVNPELKNEIIKLSKG